MYLRILCLWTIIFQIPVLFGQDSLVVDLPLATVRTVRYTSDNPGDYQMDSTTLKLYRGQTAAEVLANRTGAYIKHYGPGSIATVSLRGSSASQTSVVWNGIPVQSPMLGLTDLSVLPLWLVDNLEVRPGGLGPAWGSGAIGGSVHFGTAQHDGQGTGVTAMLETGSFGWNQQGIAIRTGNGFLRTTTKLVRQSARNNFQYHIQDSKEKFRQSNANQQLYGLLHRLDWRVNDGEDISFHVWVQESDRQIPPLITQRVSEARQTDVAIRTLAAWEKSVGYWKFVAKGGWFGEDIRYTDPVIRLDAPSSFRTFLGEVEINRGLSDGSTVSAGLQQQWISARADGYPQGVTQRRTSAFAFITATQHTLTLRGGVRQEWTDAQPAFFSPGLTASWRASDNFILSATSSRTYRLPTLNDLFWTPGGQHDLAPEQGWSHEAGLQMTPDGPWSFEISVFHRDIRNWILWAPLEGQAYWSATNLARVTTQGVEPRIQFKGQLPGFTIRMETGADWISSTNKVDLQVPRIETGQQLFYTPEWRAFSSITIETRGWLFNYEHQYTGGVNTFSTPLPAFTTGNLHLRYQAPRGALSTSFWLRLDNLWDASFMIVERRPMPGRRIRVGLTLDGVFKGSPNGP